MKNKIYWLKNIIIPILLIVVFEKIDYRWDMTQDKRFTLNESTITLLSEIEKPLKIDIFLSGQLPAEYLRLQREIITLIKGMEKYTNQLIFSFIDPFEGASSTDSLIEEMNRYGLSPEYIVTDQKQALEQTIIFPWAIVNDGNKTLKIRILKKILGDDEQQKINRSIAQLEFQFYNALFKINQKQKSNLAVLTSHGTTEAVKIADFMSSIDPYYQLASFDLKALEDEPEKTLENLKRFKLLFVSNPTEPFNEIEKYLLDQHLIHGGRQWWAINSVAVNRDSLFNPRKSAVVIGRSLNMENTFFKYGFRLKKNLIKDLYCAPIVLARGTNHNAQYLPYPMPYYPLVKPRSNELFGSRSGNVFVPFPSTIDTLKNQLDKTILIGSSNFSHTIQTPTSISLEEFTKKINPTFFDQKSQPLGILIEGEFKSVFENRVPPLKLDFNRAKGISKMIVFSSGSIAENQVDKGNPLELGYDKWTNNLYSNKLFLQKTVHYLMDNQKLLRLLNKTVDIPRLDAQKIKQISDFMKILLLLTPLLIVSLIGGIVYIYRIRSYSR